MFAKAVAVISNVTETWELAPESPPGLLAQGAAGSFVLELVPPAPARWPELTLSPLDPGDLARVAFSHWGICLSTQIHSAAPPAPREFKILTQHRHRCSFCFSVQTRLLGFWPLSSIRTRNIPDGMGWVRVFLTPMDSNKLGSCPSLAWFPDLLGVQEPHSQGSQEWDWRLGFCKRIPAINPNKRVPPFSYFP